jgi:aspartate/glutamate racemase
LHIGLIGGMGSVASSVFLQTLYEEFRVSQESDYPKITYLADPCAPPRRAGQEDALRSFIQQQAQVLWKAGATDLAICCMVAHSLSIELPLRVHSLKVIANEMVEAQGMKNVVFVGGRLLSQDINVQKALFGRDITESFASQQDSTRFFQIIEHVKLNALTAEDLTFFKNFAEKHRDKTVILCCSELHVVVKSVRPDAPSNVLDPLLVLAQRLAERNRVERGIRLSQ